MDVFFGKKLIVWLEMNLVGSATRTYYHTHARTHLRCVLLFSSFPFPPLLSSPFSHTHTHLYITPQV